MIIKLVLFVFLFFILLILLLGVSLIRSAKNVFFGGGGKHTGNRHQASRPEDKSDSGHSETRRSYGFRKRKKIIGKDEGEYVDYEEIKE
ncbi:MAG: DUF4834 family protein [Parabacteroides sp.]|nr:DUF4834 family protein [Parabacteroides sp.]